MSDPKFPPEQREAKVKVFANIPERGDYEEVLYFRIPKNFEEPTDDAARKVFENGVLAQVKKINASPGKGASIAGLGTVFSFVDKTALNDFTFGNTIAVANLPYCLHIPQGSQLEVQVPGSNLRAHIVFNKVWTYRARTDKEKSEEAADFYAEDRVLYYNQSALISPVLPLKPEAGWDGGYTGFNCEKVSDQSGDFRYTRMTIQFNTKVSAEEFNKSRDQIKSETFKEVLKICNRVIDVYRFVTKESSIRRRTDINVHMIYFKEFDSGEYVLTSKIGTAIINRSKNEIDSFVEMLENGKKVSAYELLFLDAQHSFDSDNFTLAIAESFQGFEVFLEGYLTQALKDTALDDAEIEKLLSDGQNWKTTERLKSVLKKVKNVSLAEANPTLWVKWLGGYKEVRNKVLHAGKEPTAVEVEGALKANREVVDWILSI